MRTVQIGNVVYSEKIFARFYRHRLYEMAELKNIEVISSYYRMPRIDRNVEATDDGFIMRD